MEHLSAPSSKSLVLIVEDDRAQSYSLARILRHAGFHAFEVLNIQEAKKALQTKPDIVIMDIRLPDGDGSVFCAEIKSDQSYQRIPVILISASLHPNLDPGGPIASKADAFLVKPISAELLLETIRLLIDERAFVPNRPAL